MLAEAKPGCELTGLISFDYGATVWSFGSRHAADFAIRRASVRFSLSRNGLTRMSLRVLEVVSSVVTIFTASSEYSSIAFFAYLPRAARKSGEVIRRRVSLLMSDPD